MKRLASFTAQLSAVASAPVAIQALHVRAQYSLPPAANAATSQLATGHSFFGVACSDSVMHAEQLPATYHGTSRPGFALRASNLTSA